MIYTEQTGTPAFSAEARNQYGKPIGYGTGTTQDEAASNARTAARGYLKSSSYNPNWKYRIAKVTTTKNP